jgi:3-deoxy-D-manno-octulosonic-acid transferase
MRRKMRAHRNAHKNHDSAWPDPRSVRAGVLTWRVEPGEILYDTVLRVAPHALRVVAPFHGKLRRGLAGRRGALTSMQAWAGQREAGRPLVWVHAPSVGEALMAQAILAAILRRAPTAQSAFTFFSPSAERVAAEVGADWHGYLPWDRAADARRALDALKPDCIAFVRTEIWPVLGREARSRGCQVVLLNAVLAEGSSRTGPGARLLLGPAYRRLDAVGAVSHADAARFPRLGVDADRIHVTGDARFDQVWQRIRRLDHGRPVLRALRAAAGPRLVAGSTWPADDDRLLPALARLKADGAAWRLIAAPHEPTPAHTQRLERALAAAGLSCARLPQDGAAALPDTDALVVDRVGILADLYAVADAAYVGGGFGSAGLHSIVEPAALGVPVLYGPRHGNAREADELAAAGGGFIARDATQLRALLGALHTDADQRARASTAARAFVADRIGAADRNAELVLDRLRGPGHRER